MGSKWWLAGGLAGATVLAWMGRLHPVLELFPNARPVLLLVAVGGLGWFVIRDARGPAAIAGAVAIVNAAYLAPFALATPDPRPEGDSTSRVLQYNIFYNNDDLEAVLDEITTANADVVAIHELLPETWSTLEPELAEQYPHRYAVPFDEFEGQPSGGMALLSRAPLDPIEVDAQYSPPDRVLLAASTQLNGQQVRLIGLHPHASRFESRKIELREAQIEGVVELASTATTPVIVLADMNVTPTSHVYTDLLSDLGWRDPHKVAGWDATWPTWGGPLGFPIDHVLVSNDFAIHGVTTSNGGGSDHRSVVAEVSFREERTETPA